MCGCSSCFQKLTPPLPPWFVCAAVVFVIDSCHRDRLMEAHSELAKLLTEKELRDALLLIFANKQVRTKQPSTRRSPASGQVSITTFLLWRCRTFPEPCPWRRWRSCWVCTSCAVGGAGTSRAATPAAGWASTRGWTGSPGNWWRRGSWMWPRGSAQTPSPPAGPAPSTPVTTEFPSLFATEKKRCKCFLWRSLQTSLPSPSRALTFSWSPV